MAGSDKNQDNQEEKQNANEQNEKNDTIQSDIINFLSSMKVGLILLILLAVISSLGSFIPQKEEPGVYFGEYGETIGEMILTLGLDNIFEVWWFVGLIVLVCANLLFCNFKRLPSIYKRAFKPEKVTSKKKIKSFTNSADIEAGFPEEQAVNKVQNDLKQLNYKAEVKENDEGEKIIFAEKGRFSYLGSFLTHISILIIVVGFAYGNYVGFEDFVSGVPGEVVEVEKADFDLRVDDFEIDYRDDYSVEQYNSTLTVLEEEQEIKQEKIYVNRPLRYDGINFYQSTHGWTAKLTVESQDNNFQDTLRMYEGGHFHYPQKNKVVYFHSFYPDYDVGIDGPINVSPKPNNPHFIWLLYVDNQMEDMFVSAPGEAIEYRDTMFKFHDYSQYTGLRVVHDPGVPVFIAGSILMLVGLILSFYLYPRRVWAVVSSQGDKSKIIAGGRGLKDKASFNQEFEKIMEKLDKR